MTRERKVLIIIGCVLILAGGLYRFMPQDSEWFGSGEQLALKHRMLAKYTRLIQENRNIDKRLARLEKTSGSLSDLLLTGSTPALAAVDVQNTLTRLAERADVQINRVSVKKFEKIEDGPLLAIPVQFNVDTTVRQLRDLISSIESCDKLFRITQISSRAVYKKESAVLIKTTITLEGFIFES